MCTRNQILLKKIKLKKKKKLKFLMGKPQRKGICQIITWVAPKKPNSARRKVAKVWFFFTRKATFCYIPGEEHNLQEHATVLVRGGRTKDIPGMKYKIIRGCYSASAVEWRSRARSKYGTKAWIVRKMKRLKTSRIK